MSRVPPALRAMLALFSVVAVLGTAIAGFFTFRASTAHQTAKAAGTTQYVSNTVAVPASGSNTDCAHPGFTTVQAAVDAASANDTVYLCGTTPYKEQVIIHTSITLKGDSGAVLQAPTTFPSASSVLSKLPTQFTSDNLLVPQAIVIVWGSGVNVGIVGITISGTMSNGTCLNLIYGILAINNAKVGVSGATVKDIRDTNSGPAGLIGCQFGNAIQIGSGTWRKTDYSLVNEPTFNATGYVVGSTIIGYQKTGILVGGTGSFGSLEGNTITGWNRGTFADKIAANGIQISRGATGIVTDNTIIGNTYTGPYPASAAGLIVYGGAGDPISQNVFVFSNTFTNNDVAIDVENYDASGNVATDTPINTCIVGNTITNDQVTNKGPINADTASPPHQYNGYQAGILDISNTDTFAFNTITGTGYTPQGSFGHPLVVKIDTNYPLSPAKNPTTITSPLTLSVTGNGTNQTIAPTDTVTVNYGVTGTNNCVPAIGQIAFYDGSNTTPILTTYPGDSGAITGLSVGVHTITPKFVPDSGFPYYNAATGTPFTITVKDTTSPTPTPAPTTTPTTGGSNQAYIRFVSAAQAYTAANVTVDGSPLFSGVAPCTVNAYVPVSAGNHSFGLSATGLSAAGTFPLNLAAGSYTTLALGSGGAVLTFTDDQSVVSGKAKVRFYNLGDGATTVDFKAGSTVLAAGVAPYTASAYAAQDPGTYTYTYGSTSAAVSVSANKVYSVFNVCGNQAVPAATDGVPTSLPQTGFERTIANFTWLIVGFALAGLIVTAFITRRTLAQTAQA